MTTPLQHKDTPNMPFLNFVEEMEYLRELFSHTAIMAICLDCVFLEKSRLTTFLSKMLYPTYRVHDVCKQVIPGA